MSWGEFVKGQENDTANPICLPGGYPAQLWNALISWNKIDWLSVVQVFWYNPDVGTSTETIWDAGGLYSYLQNASTLSISSTEDQDTDGGTGANKIIISWLDANYMEISEEITMDGQNVVTTEKSFLRIHEMRVLTAWDDAKALWVITAKVWATIYWQINDWANKSLMAMFTIPKWKVGFVLQGKSTADGTKTVEVSFFSRLFWSVFALIHFFNLYGNNYWYKFEIPALVPEKTDLEVRWLAIQTTAKIWASFEILLVDKKKFNF